MPPTLTHLTFDCDDAAALAAFWANVLDLPVEEGASPDYALLPGTPAWMFLRVAERKAVKNRMHPDLTSDDLPGELVRLKDLGATHLADHTEDGTTWATLADPEGNEFDIVGR